MNPAGIHLIPLFMPYGSLLHKISILVVGYLTLSRYDYAEGFAQAYTILGRGHAFTHLISWKTHCASSSKGEHAFTTTLISSSHFINLSELE